MATLKKVKTVLWVNGEGKRVLPGTEGAKKRTIVSKKWYIVDKVGGKVVRTPTYTDKKAATTALATYLKAKERGESGLADPFKKHLDRRTTEHLAEYIREVKQRARTEAYPKTVERELTKLFKLSECVTLRDLTADRIATYLATLTVRATTKNKFRTYLFSFCAWLVKRDRLPGNPIDKVDPAKLGQQDEEPRRRRAMTRRELRNCLSAVERYPLLSVGTNKGGRPRKDGTRPAPSVANLTPETVAEKTALGHERRLVYRTALLTGLRRGELSRVKVRHCNVRRGRIDLPGHLTKNGKPGIIPLVPTLKADLKEWIADTARGPEDLLFYVPEGRNLVTLHKAHLKLAGVAYETDQGFADFHSLRKTVNTLLRRKGVPHRLRQRFLRHAAADLATKSYDDERLNELAPVVQWLDRLDRYMSAAEAVGG